MAERCGSSTRPAGQRSPTPPARPPAPGSPRAGVGLRPGARRGTPAWHLAAAAARPDEEAAAQLANRPPSAMCSLTDGGTRESTGGSSPVTTPATSCCYSAGHRTTCRAATEPAPRPNARNASHRMGIGERLTGSQGTCRMVQRPPRPPTRPRVAVRATARRDGRGGRVHRHGHRQGLRVLASVRTRRVVRLLPHKAGNLITVDISAGLPGGLIKVDAREADLTRCTRVHARRRVGGRPAAPANAPRR